MRSRHTTCSPPQRLRRTWNVSTASAYGYRNQEADNLFRYVCPFAFRRIRRRGQAADHARHLLPVRRLLRRLLSQGQKVRRLIKEDYDRAFERVDAILAPVSPTPAFPIGSKINDPLQMYLADIYTISLNLAGLPGISVPAEGQQRDSRWEFSSWDGCSGKKHSSA